MVSKTRKLKTRVKGPGAYLIGWKKKSQDIMKEH